MNSITSLCEALYPYDYSIVSEANDRVGELYNSILPFEAHEYKTGSELNGWKIPPAYKLLNGTIEHAGKVILDGKSHPFSVGILSPNVDVTITGAELKKRLYRSMRDDGTIPHHWLNLYRPKSTDWAFCVSHKFYNDVRDKENYRVNIESSLLDGTMKVYEYTLRGDTPGTYLVNAHNCHPFQANDDVSGVATAIDFFRTLSKLPRRKYTYTLLICPELYGPVYWLDQFATTRDILGCVLLKSVGRGGKLRIQNSFNGDSDLDYLTREALLSTQGVAESHSFRTLYGNDETAFEAPGFRIPTVTLTRYPFDQYHTSGDTPDKLSESDLKVCRQTLVRLFENLESNFIPTLNFRGLVSLSNQTIDLYKPAFSPGMDKGNENLHEHAMEFHRFMNYFPILVDNKSTIASISKNFNLRYEDIIKYVNDWIGCGLIRDNSAVVTNFYSESTMEK